MSFSVSGLYLDRENFNSSTENVGVAFHKYKSAADNLASITATGYFNPIVSVDSERNNTTTQAQLQIGDAIAISGTDGSQIAFVTAIDPDVEIVPYD